MAQNSDNEVLPTHVVTRENSNQSISISTISNEVVEEEVRINVQATSIRRKKENKIHPFSVSSPTLSNESVEGRTNFERYTLENKPKMNFTFSL